MKSNYDALGNYIRLVDTRNTDFVTEQVLGINIDKYFMPSVANVIGTDLSKYKLITKGKFACNPMHVGRDERLPVALYTEDEPAIVSPAYFMLASTGMRVGEMVLLNRADINFNERECVVFGKGDKERIVYFDARTKIHLQNYLNSRRDENPALFVSLQKPHKRLQISGIEVRLREYGKRLGLSKVHPHKFRRTLATMAIDKGMPIEQLQQLLGHRRIDTTLQYAMVKQSNVKIAHRKYIG